MQTSLLATGITAPELARNSNTGETFVAFNTNSGSEFIGIWTTMSEGLYGFVAFVFVHVGASLRLHTLGFATNTCTKTEIL